MHPLLHSVPPTLHQATADPRLCQRLLDTQQTSLGQSLVRSLLLSPGSWCAQSFVFALPESVSPVLCKFSQLYGTFNGNLFQERLSHSQACCIQSPYSCGRPLLTNLHRRHSNTQGQVWLSLCGVSWYTQSLV